MRLTLWRLQSLAHLCVSKGLTDKKLKLIYGNVNYKNIIYYILFVIIILTYSMENYSPQLKL